MDLDKIIELAKELARPYKITTAILAVLLALSICINVYVLTRPMTVSFDAGGNNFSEITQSNEG